MSDLRQAAQQALEVLERAGEELRWQAIGQVQRDLRAALAEPEERQTMTPKELAASLKRGEKWTLAEPVEPVQWTDADADAARLALELEALLMDTKDLAVVSRWWDSGHDALELHRQRLRSERDWE